MSSFRFKAATIDDRLETGTVDAKDRLHATQQLMDKGLYVVSLEAAGQGLLGKLQTPITMDGLSRVELAQILSDLGHLIQAGVELASALALLSQTEGKPRCRKFVHGLEQQVRSGVLLSDAFKALPNKVPPRIAALVRAGEVADRLGPLLIEISESERRMAKMLSDVTTALIYPCCIMVAMLAAIGVLVGVVVPTLETLFGDQIGRLPWQTQMLVAFSRSLRAHYLLSAASIIAIVLGAIGAWRTYHLRLLIEKGALAVPFLGSLVRSSETAQVASLMAMYAFAKIPLADAVSLTSQGVKLATSRAAFSEAVSRVREGAGLTQAMLKIPTLTDRMVALVTIGDSTGRLNELLGEASRDAERQLSIAVSRFLALLTPLMTITFGVLAGFVLYAVMKAILSVNDFAMGR